MSRWKGILSALALVLITAGVLSELQHASHLARESGQRSLLKQAEQKLAAYHAEHGKYPDSLAGFQFLFDDGAKASMLERFEYRTDGKYYRIVTKSEFDESELSVCH
jgi:hypothetical protein